LLHAEPPLPQVSAWQQHTTAALQEVWLEGLGHNYIADAPESLLQTIISQLSCPSSNNLRNPAAGPEAAAQALNKQQQHNAAPVGLQQQGKTAPMTSTSPQPATLKECCPCQ
jgi:hypothetical protein